MMINDVLEYNRLLCEKMGPIWLRRNSTCYNLVSYVNNLTCLFLGEQYTDVALFIKRIDAELERLEKHLNYHYEYFVITKSYMQKIVEYLFQNNLLSESGISLLPEKYQTYKEIKIVTQNLNRDLQILFNNYDCKEGSFIHYLHEKATFNEQAFGDYYNSILSITKKKLQGELIDTNTTIAIVLTHKTILESFIWHLTEKDIYQITDYPMERINYFMEQLNYLIDGYLKGYIIEDDNKEYLGKGGATL